MARRLKARQSLSSRRLQIPLCKSIARPSRVHCRCSCRHERVYRYAGAPGTEFPRGSCQHGTHAPSIQDHTRRYPPCKSHVQSSPHRHDRKTGGGCLPEAMVVLMRHVWSCRKQPPHIALLWATKVARGHLARAACGHWPSYPPEFAKRSPPLVGRGGGGGCLLPRRRQERALSLPLLAGGIPGVVQQ
jgi:hypothetical protein